MPRTRNPMKTKRECLLEFEENVYNLERRYDRGEFRAVEYQRRLRGLRDDLAKQLGINLEDPAIDP